MAIAPVVALEIGTSRVIALVGEMREDDGHIMVTGIGEYPSVGLRKGEIIDMENAAICVRSAIESAEEGSNVSIRSVHLAVSGGHIQSLVNRGAVPVLDKSGTITEDDIDQVMEVARAVNLPQEREIIHTICQQFTIDDHARVVRPEGMEGAKLSLDMLVLHGVRNLLRNHVKTVTGIPLDVEDVVFSGLCSAMAVLTPEQKKSGALVIDLGGGKTDYVAYAGNVVAGAGAIGVGGEHINNDIALAFNIPHNRAERIKEESGSAVIERGAAGEHVSLPAEVGFPGRTVNLGALQTVIRARVEETLGMVRQRVEEAELMHQFGAGVVLTGGGAHLRGVTELAGEIFGLPCVVGHPRNISGLATATDGPEYATASGLVQYGFKSYAEQKRESTLKSVLRNLFGR